MQFLTDEQARAFVHKKRKYTQSGLPRKPRKVQLTAPQTEFLDLLATGLSQREVAKRFHWSLSRVYTLMRNSLAQQYLSSIRAESRAIVVYDIATAMEEALADHAFAISTKNANAAVKATELRAKLSGLLIERVELFTADLRGALDLARRKVIQVSPEAEAVLTQLVEAPAQAEAIV